MGSESGGSEEAGCPKCGWTDAAVDRTTTGVKEGVVAAAGVDTYTVVTCERCGYTEFYAEEGDSAAVDLFLGRGYVPPGERERATMKSAGDVFHCGTCGTAFTDGDAAECPGCGREFV
ncbi:zinc ribbon domain-containing protein [Halobaculum sp. EA56]|uniref:zinc ribbon domain-containing protein n=1 Tax=Halobaculum sp. EA56 TaxID=3421648 RepID=UPI003EB90639